MNIFNGLQSIALLSNLEADDRLFALDAGMLLQAGFVIISTLVLFILLGYLLFDPVKDVLAKRTERIRANIQQAADIKKAAAELQGTYEAKLHEVDKEAEAILTDSRRKALLHEKEIVARAEGEAEQILARGRLEIKREKEQAKDDMRKEIIAVATIMASKFVETTIDENRKEALIVETIDGMDDETWLS